jgi:hypothetical protein
VSQQQRTVNVPASTSVSENFAVTCVGDQQISGRVTQGGTGLSGVTLTFSNGGGTTTTNTNGDYSRSVPWGWTGTVTPSRTECVFIPAGRSYENVTSALTAQNYAASCAAPTGTLTVSNSFSGPNQPSGPFNVVMLNDDTNEEVVRSITRNGSITETLTAGSWFVTLVGSGIGPGTNCSVSQQQRTVNVPASTSVSENFAVTCVGDQQISGRVTQGGTGLSGVTLTFSNGGGTTTTNTNGDYSRSVPWGWTGTVTPSRTECVFIPAGRSYENVTSALTAQNYAASCAAPTGTLTVSNSFSGPNQPSGPFNVVMLNDDTNEEVVRSITRNGSITETLTAGSWFVTLVGSGIGPGTNCSVSQQQRTRNVPAGGSVSENFAVTCN